MTKLLLVLCLCAIVVHECVAQCAVRRSLPVGQRPPYFWNAEESTSTFSLPPVMTGAFRQFLTAKYGGGMWKDVDLRVEWQCLVKTPTGEFSSDTTHLWSVSDTNPSLLINPQKQVSKQSLKCYMVPLLSPAYLKLYEEWKREKAVAPETFVGTNFPWFPCADLNAYTDNEVLVNFAALSTSTNTTANFTAATAASPVKKVWVSAVEAAKLATWATVKSFSTSQDEYVIRACDELLDIDTYDLEVVKRFAQTSLVEPGFQVSNVSWENVVLSLQPETSDTCHQEWSSEVLVVQDQNTNKQIKFMFNASPTPPVINNGFADPAQLPVNLQCATPQFKDILERVDTAAFREKVHGTHRCQQGVPFPTTYTWRYVKVVPRQFITDQEFADECTNSGMFVHMWTARACSQTTTSTVIQRVADTTPPVLNYASPRLTKLTNNLVVFQQCWWPTNVRTMFCPEKEIAESVKTVVSDNCFENSKLKIKPDWKSAVWSFCTPTSCLAQSSLDGPGAADKCFLQSHLTSALATAPTNSVLRLAVYVTISDPCKNTVPERMLWTTTFVDPAVTLSEIFTTKYCSRVNN